MYSWEGYGFYFQTGLDETMLDEAMFDLLLTAEFRLSKGYVVIFVN
jgi:hypothetical protein